MLTLPHPVTNDLRLADWLELMAVLSADKNSSTGDLERILKRSALFEAADSETIERKCLAVFSELEGRAIAAADGYPFSLAPSGVLQMRADLNSFPTYMLCLCLSFWKWRQPKGGKIFPRRLFENISRVAAINYLGGEGVRFASPRTSLSKSFAEAVDELCASLGEGEGFYKQKTGAAKDDTLDVVAWKAFPDGRFGKLILFGQCASGAEQDSKRAELQPAEFCDQWFMRAPTVCMVKAFFIPHRLARDEWEKTTRKAGIVFDRCRLARWAHGQEDEADKPGCFEWCSARLRVAQAEA